MMNAAYAVIGAGFGDEGKGLTTDFLARKLTKGRAPMVARGNGGAQAGHTVETADGKRHVFGHIGAGTFANSETYLAQNFIVNPQLFAKEIEMLDYDTSMISAHPACLVTTIYDMALNSLRELSRGSERHGSCGMGVNETITRSENYPIHLIDIHSYSPYALAGKLSHIYHSYWYPEYQKLRQRCAFGEEAAPFVGMFEAPSFEYDAGHLQVLKRIRLAHPFDPPGYDRSLIVEGAQGLMLDEHLGTFPHVTRSITGLPSALLVARELHYKDVHPVYVTRPYATRHGAGPLLHEDGKITNQEIPVDKTNVHGPWQGSFRYATLDMRHLSIFIHRDMQRSSGLAKFLGVKVREPVIMITCMDQMGHTMYISNHEREIVEISTNNLKQVVEMETGLKVKYLSYGPKAEDVREV
jgi:adenylosuccinate synthase